MSRFVHYCRATSFCSSLWYCSVLLSPPSSSNATYHTMNMQIEPGPATLIEELVKAAKKDSPYTRAAAMGLLQAMCAKSPVDLNEHVPQLMIITTEALNDPSDAVCEKAWFALEALVKVCTCTCTCIVLIYVHTCKSIM